MDKAKFIIHRAKRILHLDFSNASVEEMLAGIQEAQRVIASEPPNSVSTLTDFTNARYNREVNAALQEYVKHNKPYVKAAAVVGVTGIKQVVLNAVLLFSRRTISAFDNLEDAKNWLVTAK